MANASRQSQFNTGDTLTEAALEGEFDYIYNCLNGTNTIDVEIKGDLAVEGGDVTLSAAATDLDVIDNNSSALSVDSAAQAGILEIDSSTGATGIKTAGYLTVAGNAAVTGDTVTTGKTYTKYGGETGVLDTATTATLFTITDPGVYLVTAGRSGDGGGNLLATKLVLCYTASVAGSLAIVSNGLTINVSAAADPLITVTNAAGGTIDIHASAIMLCKL